MKRKLQIAAFLTFVGLFSIFLLPRLFVAGANTDASLNIESPANAVTVTNQLPEIQELRHSKIGLGQRLTFGVEVIDEEGDNIRVELLEKPKSAQVRRI